MNCKPGDMAVIVAVDHPEFQVNIGAFVHVVRGSYPDETGRACWIISPKTPLLGNSGRFLPAGMEGRCRDDNLRPIRPPGEQIKKYVWQPLEEPVHG